MFFYENIRPTSSWLLFGVTTIFACKKKTSSCFHFKQIILSNRIFILSNLIQCCSALTLRFRSRTIKSLCRVGHNRYLTGSSNTNLRCRFSLQQRMRNNFTQEPNVECEIPVGVWSSVSVTMAAMCCAAVAIHHHHHHHHRSMESKSLWY